MWEEDEVDEVGGGQLGVRWGTMFVFKQKRAYEI